jgi:hypothetical protein
MSPGVGVALLREHITSFVERNFPNPDTQEKHA